MSFLQEIKACAVETERDLKRLHEAVVMSDSQQASLTDKVAFLTVELSSIRVACASPLWIWNK